MIPAPFDTRSDETVINALTHDPKAYPVALGCHGCHHFAACGGLCVKGLFDCLDLCCNDPDNCTRVCRKAPSVRFANQLREIDGFDFGNVPRAPLLKHQIRDDIVPLVYHGSSRVDQLSGTAFALRLTDIVNFREKTLKFSDRAALCAAYRIPEDAQLILSGVNQDHRIEPWWTLGSAARLGIIEQMRRLGIDLVTTPNFSVVLDQPRTDDMHAMKRILIAFTEFSEGGIPCALHAHGRTERDFERWAAEIAARTEIEVLSYEFTTGPGRRARRSWHLDQLAGLATAAGRDLDIVVRGDPQVVEFLRGHFRKVIYLETSAFMKTLKRQRAERDGNDRLRWALSPTEPGEALDGLFSHNLRERVSLLRSLYYAGEAAE
jgi:hypothetical protein